MFFQTLRNATSPHNKFERQEKEDLRHSFVVGDKVRASLGNNGVGILVLFKQLIQMQVLILLMIMVRLLP